MAQTNNGAQAPLCPLMSRSQIAVEPADPRLVGVVGAKPQVAQIFAPVPCQKEACAFFHKAAGYCSIPLIADRIADLGKV